MEKTDVSPDAVRTACRHSGLGPVRTVRRRTGGRLSSVFEVDADGRRWIVKAYAPQWAWKQRKEVHVYALLRAAVGPYLPEVVDVQDESSPLGFAYTVLTCLPGAPLSEVPDAAGRDMYRSVGELAAAVHTVGQPAYGYIVTSVLDPFPDNAAYMTRQFEKKLAEFVSAGGPEGVSRRVERRLEQDGRALQFCARPVLCHNDLHAGNLLVERSDGDWRLSGLVDVENAVAADPLLDLAKTHVYSIRTNDVLATAFAEGYRLDLDTAARTRFDLYRVYHTLELWDWFHDIGEHDPLPGLLRQLIDLLDTDRA